MAAHNDIFHFIGRPRTKHATINVQEPECIISLHDQRINYTAFLILIYSTIFFTCVICALHYFGYLDMEDMVINYHMKLYLIKNHISYFFKKYSADFFMLVETLNPVFTSHIALKM